jgi:hypothetical protein
MKVGFTVKTYDSLFLVSFENHNGERKIGVATTMELPNLRVPHILWER